MTTESLEQRVRDLESLVSRLNNQSSFGELRYGQPDISPALNSALTSEIATRAAADTAESTARVAGDPITSHLTGDFTKNNDTTFANVTDGTNLLRISLAASTYYYFNAVIEYNSNSTADYKWTFTIPTGATGDMEFNIILPGTAVFAIQSYPNLTSTISAEGIGADTGIFVKGKILTTNAGYLQVQAAQNTANVSNTLTKAGSLIIAWKLP